MDFLPAIQAENSESFRNHSQTAILDDLDKMNKELLTLEEQFLRLGVRTHLLEVELATQFSPDLLEDQEEIQLTCQECELVVDQERQRIASLCVGEMETESCVSEKHADGNEVITSAKDTSSQKSLEADVEEAIIDEMRTGGGHISICEEKDEVNL